MNISKALKRDSKRNRGLCIKEEDILDNVKKKKEQKKKSKQKRIVINLEE